MAAGAHRVFLLLILFADLKGTHSIQYVCMAKVTGLVVMLCVTVINNVCVCVCATAFSAEAVRLNLNSETRLYAYFGMCI